MWRCRSWATVSRDRRDAWLVFLSMEEPEAILDLLECCPDFGKLYGEIDQQKEISQQKEKLDQKDRELEELRKRIQELESGKD